MKEGANKEKNKIICIATLADQVQENQMKIKEMETAQERTESKVDEVIMSIHDMMIQKASPLESCRARS